MSSSRRPARFPACGPRFVAAAVVVALVAAAARAEDDGVRAEGVAGERQGEQDGNVVDLEANFDSNVFEQTGAGWVIRHNAGPFAHGGLAFSRDGEAGSPAVARVRAMGRARLERLDRACGLAAGQRRRLELALEADIRRCVVEIEEVRRSYAGVTVNMRERDGQQTWSRFQQDVQRCRRRLLTLFDDSSLYAESLATVLDDEQQAALAAELAARRAFHWRSLVATAMLRLDDTLALTHDQHAEIERLLLEQEPPLRLDAPTKERNEQAEQMLVFMVLAEADHKPLKAVVGDERWKTLLTLLNQGRSMRSWIEGQGLLDPKRK
jgi:hypothetical protein